MVFSVPSIIEIWSTDSEKIAFLKTLKALVFGGGPLSKKVGGLLVSQGVQLYVEYGHTESGVVSVFLPAPMGIDWEYMVFCDLFGPTFIALGDGTYELSLVAHDDWMPLVVNTKVDGKDAFSTNDLFIPHESKPGLWKIYGRSDDQIMLSTGEKTNPGPLETMLLRDEHVQAAIIFGRGKPQNGILIDPKDEFQIDDNDTEARDAFKDMIWPAIERMNAFAPQHSRIFKNMIIVSSSSKPFSYTDKGTPRRHAMVRVYNEEIERLYSDQTLETLVPELLPPTNWDESGTKEFVRATVMTVLRRHVDDDADIFRFGCDSLQATWIRTQILLALRGTVGDRTEYLPQSCVYQAPSITQLVTLARSAARVIHDSNAPDTLVRVQALRSLVAQYTISFPPRAVTLSSCENGLDVVLVTGTTGSLGAHILVHLLQDPTVGQVYALNRTSASLKQQRTTFERYGLDVNLLTSAKLHFLTGALTEPYFGLEQSAYDELHKAATHIIHSAWKVDFNQSLGSYESLVAGVHNLVDFCLSSPRSEAPRILFTSSMGIFRKLPAQNPVPEEYIADPEICLGSGYSESKWAAEQILQAAQEDTGLKTIVGASVTWVSSYDAARILVKLRDCNEPVLHLARPTPVPWKTVLEPITTELGVELVPYAAWLSALQNQLAAEDVTGVDKMRENPALRLLDHFKTVDFSSGREPLGGARMEVVKLLKEVPDLSLPDITAGSVRRWLEAWRDCGFLPSGA
ncbi:hypothetical protein EIP86_009512 [Pleurotus ostreatoroseus]|nr:hypothetical protein EIP86_009512 [Pleurotus ostreatoroseus]